ncbi:nucleotidyltransferase family protein [Capnocytophaga granulosa]|uniref:nucleotidyltransferase family protein n=1 Tax=Capnocytophaga granulosa TaxID=45242 RepID=UPI0023F10459|nr:nucleotidyltransferase domain-containing protein [Capnocytophaga granulosa]
MNSILKNQLDTIRSLCERYRVKTLYVFGSVLTPNFDTYSDIDLLVDFLDQDALQYASNYFQFKFELEKLFNRKIDLLEERALKNPYFIENINQKKQLLYE